MTKLKLSCFRHLRRRQGSSEKTMMLGKQKAVGYEETRREKDQQMPQAGVYGAEQGC